MLRKVGLRFAVANIVILVVIGMAVAGGAVTVLGVENGLGPNLASLDAAPGCSCQCLRWLHGELDSLRKKT